MILRHSHCLHLTIRPYLPQSRQQQKRSTETPAVIQVVSHNRGSYNHKGRQFVHCAMGRPHYFTQGLELVQRAGGSGCMADEDCSKIPPGGPNAKPKESKRRSTLHLYLIPWDKTCIQNVENSKTLTDQKLANDATPHGLQGQMTGSTYLATPSAVPKRKKHMSSNTRDYQMAVAGYPQPCRRTPSPWWKVPPFIYTSRHPLQNSIRAILETLRVEG